MHALPRVQGRKQKVKRLLSNNLKKKKKAIEVELVFGGSVQEVARLVQPEQSERGEITHKPCLQAHRLADL